MRRLLGPILIGLGMFLVAAAALIRFYAYPTLAVAPIDQNSVTLLSAEDATIFDSNPEVLDNVTGRPRHQVAGPSATSRARTRRRTASSAGSTRRL